MIWRCDEDWVKKCMEMKAEDQLGDHKRRIENVEVDMSELEIDGEDIHDRKKWRRNVMKRKSNPIGIRTINR